MPNPLCAPFARATGSPSSPVNGELFYRSHSPAPQQMRPGSPSNSYVKQAVYGDDRQLQQPPPPLVGTAPADNVPRLFGMPLKYVSLITLAVQNAMLAIMMHYSRVSAAPEKTYSAASAVLLNELLKGSISMFIALLRIDPDDRRRSSFAPPPTAGTAEYTLLTKSKRVVSAASPRSLGRLVARFRRLGREVFSSDCWKLSIPAILYVIQNNLQFVAASNLDVATFQVTYQMKILTTAGFSVLMLRKKLTTVKWLSLLGLAIGVGIVQIQTGSAAPSGRGHSATNDLHVMSPMKGFLAVSAACVTSGLAGVYFEMVLKGSQADLWVRNVQLSLFSLLPALVPVLFSASSPATNSGWFPWYLFANFNGWAWATVLTQVFGGLVTAVVIKYSDNIMKGFATSLSIIISFLASVALFNFSITVPFVVGSSVVLAATWFYNVPSQETPKPAAIRERTEGLGLTLSSLSLKGSGHRSSIGSPVDSSDPILGEMTPKKKSPLPTPRAIAHAIKGLVSGPSSPTETTNGSSGYFVNGNNPAATGFDGAPLHASSSSASLASPAPPSRSQSSAGIIMTNMAPSSSVETPSLYGAKLGPKDLPAGGTWR